MEKTVSDLKKIASLRLSELFALIEREEVSPFDIEASSLAETLALLAKQFERDRKPGAGKGTDVAMIEITAAWRLGLAPDGAELEFRHRYLNELAGLIERASHDRVVCRALAMHAAERIGKDRIIPAILRWFVARHLMGEFRSNPPRGRPRKTGVTDLIIVIVVDELVARHNARLVGTIAHQHEGSACWIVAEAMRELGRRPTSTSAVIKAWYRNRANEKLREPSNDSRPSRVT